ncbi:glycosyltransferase [Acetobacter estunensis NRIC 0472]|uniref:Glycosyltransferase n=1 Tax=Acetobacter estunensis TaxID=104097 RepID=A0A967B4M4_9PROT|nr:glycosyltransferase family 2 protein [Acetobacter estunensis]NHO53675.1 glycosyltransferase [Acetobacter estunensis]GBQ25192.1 glycosyltransferase [Acetobacter estunensis NRIC 0472]
MASDRLSLITPFHNEAEVVGHFARTLRPILDAIADTEWEILCIDDGSTDNTLSLLLEEEARDPRFRIIEFSRNFGKEAALTAGLDLATGQAVVVMDADLQDPPELIGQMVEKWRAGADVVQARRVDRSSDSVTKRVTASWFYALHNRLATIRIPENVGDFRLMDRCVVSALKQLPERQRFMKGLFAWVGFHTETLDYVRPTRSAGSTKFSGVRLWNFAIEGLTSFSTLPLRVWSYIGMIGAFLTLLYGFFIVIRTMVFGNPVPGYASLFFAVTFLGSLQIMSVGILGEYIGRIYMETKGRPIYVIRRLHACKNDTSQGSGPTFTLSDDLPNRAMIPDANHGTSSFS